MAYGTRVSNLGTLTPIRLPVYRLSRKLRNWKRQPNRYCIHYPPWSPAEVPSVSYLSSKYVPMGTTFCSMLSLDSVIRFFYLFLWRELCKSVSLPLWLQWSYQHFWRYQENESVRTKEYSRRSEWEENIGDQKCLKSFYGKPKERLPK